MKHARLRSLPFPTELDPTATLGSGASVVFPLPAEELFDPHATFRCGQVFRWREHEGVWCGPFGESALAVEPGAEGVRVSLAGRAQCLDAVWRFLGLDAPLAEIYRRLAGDRWVGAATQALPGLRLLRQDPWECVVGYICSQFSNIPKIELNTERIARLWGNAHVLETRAGPVEVRTLPPAAVLAGVSPDALRECAVGYRCGYLTGTAQLVAAETVDLAALRATPYEEALATLLTLPGIGRKVADCILLFSLDQPQACPVDVWVRRVIHELYPRALHHYLPDAAARREKGLSELEYRAITRFAWDRWGCLAGYAQQYLFTARRWGVSLDRGA